MVPCLETQNIQARIRKPIRGNGNANDGKWRKRAEVSHQARNERGKKTYATLNIMKEAALEQIEYQMRKNEKDEEDRLLERYASRLNTPTVAYLRGDGFKGDFRKMD